MNLSKAVCERRTVRIYKNAISDNQLFTLLDKASYAPNHGMREPWRFIIFNNAQEWQNLKEVAQTKINKQKIYYEEFIKNNRFPTMVVVITPKNENFKIEREDLLAGAALIQNLQLLSWEKEIGVCWHTEFLDKDALHEPFGITKEEQVVGFVLLGEMEQIPLKEANRELSINKTTRFDMDNKMMD